MSPHLEPVSATATRNFCQADPLLDWLELYGEAHGFVRDTLRPGYDADTDMGPFMREKGRAFEAAVMRLIEPKFQVLRIAERSADAHDPDCIDRTRDAIKEGVEVIYQGVLWDRERQMYGMPDLLVRADVLQRLVETPIEHRDPEGTGYAVVDIKFTNLDLSASGLVGNDTSDRKRKAQLLVYNCALAEILGFAPRFAFLIGRSWAKASKKDPGRGTSCFDRLAPADMHDAELARNVDEACEWVRRVRREGANWQLLPTPSVEELYPNSGNSQDSPWHMAKREIAEELKDVTMLWQVSPKHRPAAHSAGVFRYDDPACQPPIFGIADSYAAKLQHILDVNRAETSACVIPPVISAERDTWGTPNPLEFYVDFETVTDLDDDFSRLPQKGGQTLIFMIGCGHVEDGEWRFSVFTCDRLTEPEEARMIDAWLAHMAEVRARLWPEGAPLLFHWSHAEVSFLEKAYNSARQRHQAHWPDQRWFDFLVKVMREEPVAVKGALAFGLKAIAKAMRKNDLIETVWDNGPGDGLGAMVGAWRCDQKARSAGISMRQLPLMKSIEAYNEVDCKVMWEIISYLRRHN